MLNMLELVTTFSNYFRFLWWSTSRMQKCFICNWFRNVFL